MKRQWVVWLLVAAFAWVALRHFTNVEELGRVLARGQWQWVLAAAFVQALFYLVQASVYQAGFAAVGVPGRTRELFPALLGALAGNVVVPGSGTALFLGELVARGHPAARVAAGLLVVRLADITSFFLVVLVGFGYLLSQHELRFYEVAAACVLPALIAAASGALVAGVRRPALLPRLLGRVQRAVNRAAAWFRRPDLLPPDWADHHARQFSEASAALAARPGALRRPLLLALVAHLVDLVSLEALFLAFHQPVGPGVLVAGFAVGILFWLVAVTPEGVGAVEAAMSLTFGSLGVPAEQAAVVTLAFRGLTLWLPVLAGFLLAHHLRAFGAAQGPSPTSPGDRQDGGQRREKL